MKKIRINVMGTLACWWQVPAWDFGVEGVALFKRPDDPKAAWNVIHLASGLAVFSGFAKRDEALEAFYRLPYNVDWTCSAADVLHQLTKGVAA